MTSYVMKNLQVDLVGNTASVCICCDRAARARP